jgi:PAS domain S-box-containing protein
MDSAKSPLPEISETEICQLNAKVPKWIRHQIRAILKARRKFDRIKPDLHDIAREAYEQYIERTDPFTGHPKPTPAPTGKLADVVGVIVPPYLPLFHNTVDCSQLPDDNAFIRASNESRLMVLLTGVANTCIHANWAIEWYTGHAAAECLGLGWLQFVHADDRKATLTNWLEHSERHQTFCVGYRLLRSDGQYGWVANFAQPRYRPDGGFAGFVGTIYQVASPGTNLVMMPEDGGWKILQARVIPVEGTHSAPD